MRKTIIHWIFLGVLGLAPAAVLAQQAAQPKTKAARGQAAKSQAKTPEPKKEDAKKEEAKIQTEEAQPKTEDDAKLTSVPGGKALGMSILGNQEAPKALVIVPWKSSELGNGPNVSTLLDDSRSEEHTSELQSRLHLVCRLLLEKKKTTNQSPPDRITHR